MESFNKNIINQQGLLPWTQYPKDVRPLVAVMPSTSLLTVPSLAPASFQVWKNPFTKHGDSGSCSSETKNKSQDQSLELEENQTDIGLHDDPVKTEVVAGSHGRLRRNLDPNLDPKKLKRIVSNRVSAQKSRLKKLQYVTEMERKARALEAEIAILHPQVAIHINQQHLIQMEQKRLNQEMSARTTNKILKEAEIEENRAEVNRLRQLHLAQQQRKVQGQIMVSAWKEQIVNPSFNHSGRQL